MKKMRLYGLTRNGGFISKVGMREIIRFLQSKDIELYDTGMGSAYNMPEYLVGELENKPEEAIVVIINRIDEENYELKYILGDDAIKGLISVLYMRRSENSWELANEYYDLQKRKSE